MSAARRPLGATGLTIHPLCLGTNVFGWSVDQARAFEILDAYVEAGGNLLDTANTYAHWARGNRGGESEMIIGAWLADRGTRDRVLIATKVGKAGGPVRAGLRADQIRDGAEASLERLQTDRIDVYYAHEDDRRTPLDETIAAFDALVRAGTVGVLGASNFGAARLEEALRTSERLGAARYEVLQPGYNLAERGPFEGELLPLCAREGLAVLPYYGLARGFLTGKYRPGGAAVSSPRARGVAATFMNPHGMAVLEAIDGVAARHRATPAQVALAWLMSRPTVAAPIASATSVAQLRELMSAVDLALDEEDIETLEGVPVA